MHSLTEYIDRKPDFSKLSQAEQVKYMAYFFTKSNKSSDFTAKNVTDAFDIVSLKQPGNIHYIFNILKKKGIFLPDKNRYKLQRDVVIELNSEFSSKKQTNGSRKISEKERKTIRNIAIAKFSKFIEKYIYETNWTLVAESCGVIEILNESTHERVRRAQRFKDPDYPMAVSKFLRAVFDFNESLGYSLIKEIISQEEIPDSTKKTLGEILSLFSEKTILRTDFPLTLKIPKIDDLIEITSAPDDFYVKLIEEINILYRNQFTISLSILVRKLFENLIIDILRKKYKTKRLSLYYDSSKRKFHDFIFLLKNLDERKEDFHYITPNLDRNFIKKINKYRETGNSSAHFIDISLKFEDMKAEKDEINYILQLLIRILMNI